MTSVARPTFSVVVINWNGGETVLRCMAALAGQVDRDFEIVLVDNASSDGSPERVRERYPEVELVQLDRNYGFAEGCNRGIERAHGDWVLTLNSDAFADPRWIRELRAAAQVAESDVGMLQSHVVFEDRPDVTNSTGILLSRHGGFIDRDYNRPDRAGRSVEEVFCPTAGAAGYRRTMLLQTRLPSGFFDRTFFMYYEDVDLGWRCQLAGWRALYIPTALVRHRFQGSSRRHGELFVPTHCMRNRARTMLKNGSVGMFARGAPESARNMYWLMRTQGVAGACSYVLAVFDGIRQRRAVTRISRRRRAEVEERWASD